jgi:anaerobic nitric oxide reductase flavorubredoxin
MAVEIQKDIYWIGVNDRTTDLFEGLWPIGNVGVTYNSYIINDEKKAIIDLAKAVKTDEFVHNIQEVFDVKELDYVILNHLEPDHTGALSLLKQIAPQCTIVCSEKAVDMLDCFFGECEKLMIVKDGDTINLGKHELTFAITPMVHWPETMMTYEKESKILFSCDAFGSYGALTGANFSDEVTDLEYYKTEALRYYANIVAKFSPMVTRAIDKVLSLDLPLTTIAPSHGLIWRKNFSEIIELYQKWAGYITGECEKGITIIYGSMYGNTEKYMNAVAQGASTTGIPIEIFDVARIHPSYILASMWKNKGIMVIAPTYEAELFPPAVHLLDYAVRKKIVNRFAAYYGSRLWSGGGQKEFTDYAEKLKWEIHDASEFKGTPSKMTLEHAEETGRKFAEALSAKF